MRTATSAGLGFQLSGEDYRNRGDEARSKVPDEEVQKAELLKSLVVLSIFGQLFVDFRRVLSIFCRFSSVMVNYLSILHSFGSSFGPSFGQSAVLLIFDLIGDYSLVLRDFWVFWFDFGSSFDLVLTVHFISDATCAACLRGGLDCRDS